MYLVIVFLTLISSLSVGFYGLLALLAINCLILAFLVSVFIFYKIAFIECFIFKINKI